MAEDSIRRYFLVYSFETSDNIVFLNGYECQFWSYELRNKVGLPDTRTETHLWIHKKRSEVWFSLYAH